MSKTSQEMGDEANKEISEISIDQANQLTGCFTLIPIF